MTEPYTTDRFNSNSATYSLSQKNLDLIHNYIDDSYLSYTQNTYIGNYSNSDLRNLTNAIYYDLANNYPILNEFIQSPQEANIMWQETQPDTSYSGSSYFAHHQGLEYTSNANYYTHWEWDSTAYNDKFWIPSWFETWSTVTTSGDFTVKLYNHTTKFYDLIILKNF